MTEFSSVQFPVSKELTEFSHSEKIQSLYTDKKKRPGKEQTTGKERQMKAARERVTLSQWMSRGEVTLTTANCVQG